MPASARLFLILGSANAALAVILGAFGAHALRARVAPEMLEVYHTGSQYHFYHALGLLAIAVLATRLPDSAMLRWSGWLMTAGIVLFSGSLYLLALSNTTWLGAITPLGGVAFLLGLAVLAIGIWR